MPPELAAGSIGKSGGQRRGGVFGGGRSARGGVRRNAGGSISFSGIVAGAKFAYVRELCRDSRGAARAMAVPGQADDRGRLDRRGHAPRGLTCVGSIVLTASRGFKQPPTSRRLRRVLFQPAALSCIDRGEFIPGGHRGGAGNSPGFARRQPASQRPGATGGRRHRVSSSGPPAAAVGLRRRRAP